MNIKRGRAEEELAGNKRGPTFGKDLKQGIEEHKKDNYVGQTMPGQPIDEKVRGNVHEAREHTPHADHYHTPGEEKPIVDTPKRGL
jgi:hypothetical protein